jgi:hypothetical protein
MIRPDLSRLRQLGLSEIVWRSREAAEIGITRAGAAVRAPRWDRRELIHLLHRRGELDSIRQHLHADRWSKAHAALSTHFSTQPARFVIAPHMRAALVDDILQRFPAAVADATARANRMLEGRYETLGYRDVRFDGRHWHTDAVHGKSAPVVFWSQVPYLDPQYGDHKIIWELNRHQHWMELGRAYWLTSDRRYRDEYLAQLDTWLAANPPRMGVNWASMLELAFRSLSWIWALNFFAERQAEDRSPWMVDLLLGVDRQLAHVERHLSYYFSPNTHLLGEALALYVAGRALPELRASERRATIGRRILVREIGRQIAADGVHCERSAHYHRYTLDFYLLALGVARLTDDPAAAVFERACARLAYAARILADDEGRLPLIGDDDGGTLLPLTRRRPDDVRDSLAIAAAFTGRTDLLVGEPPEELWWLAGHRRFAEGVTRVERAPKRTVTASTALAAAGYYVSRNDAGDHLIVDGGPHGYLNGGHAHADALSLTFTSRGRPLLIDTGTGGYTIDARIRDRFRATDLHNTLTLDGRSQSRPRGPFHWAHVANGSAARWRTNQRFDYFAGVHDGYAPLFHWRHVVMVHRDLLLVADCVTEDGDPRAPAQPPRASRRPEGGQEDVASAHHRAAVQWHLGPAWSFELRNRHQALLTTHDQSVDLAVTGGTLEDFRGDEATGLGWYAPIYGRIEPTTTLRIAGEGKAPFWLVSVFGLEAGNAVRAVSLHPLTEVAGPLHHATAMRIERVQSVDHVIVAEPLDERQQALWRYRDVECDAAMLFMREAGARLDTVAWVEGRTFRSNSHPQFERSHPAVVGDLFVRADDARYPGQAPAPPAPHTGTEWPATNGSEKRKAS